MLKARNRERSSSCKKPFETDRGTGDVDWERIQRRTVPISAQVLEYSSSGSCILVHSVATVNRDGVIFFDS